MPQDVSFSITQKKKKKKKSLRKIFFRVQFKHMPVGFRVKGCLWFRVNGCLGFGSKCLPVAMFCTILSRKYKISILGISQSSTTQCIPLFPCRVPQESSSSNHESQTKEWNLSYYWKNQTSTYMYILVLNRKT